MKTYFGMKNPPVKIAKIAIGDGTVTDEVTFELLPAVSSIVASLCRCLLSPLQLSIIETYPQLIGYDIEVYNYFKEQ
jgi:carboxypeptidase D